MEIPLKIRPTSDKTWSSKNIIEQNSQNLTVLSDRLCRLSTAFIIQPEFSRLLRVTRSVYTAFFCSAKKTESTEHKKNAGCRIKKRRARITKNAGHVTKKRRVRHKKTLGTDYKKTQGNDKQKFSSRLLICVFFEHYKFKKLKNNLWFS